MQLVDILTVCLKLPIQVSFYYAQIGNENQVYCCTVAQVKTTVCLIQLIPFYGDSKIQVVVILVPQFSAERIDTNGGPDVN